MLPLLRIVRMQFSLLHGRQCRLVRPAEPVPALAVEAPALVELGAFVPRRAHGVTAVRADESRVSWLATVHCLLNRAVTDKSWPGSVVARYGECEPP